jgi:hypothetical protein
MATTTRVFFFPFQLGSRVEEKKQRKKRGEEE